MQNDLIRRSALLKVPNVRRVTEYDEAGYGMTYSAIPEWAVMEAPTIDAVEVVRCRECKYNTGRHNSTPWLEGDIVCEWWGTDGVPDDGFCHKGAKMDGGAEG